MRTIGRDGAAWILAVLLLGACVSTGDPGPAPAGRTGTAAVEASGPVGPPPVAAVLDPEPVPAPVAPDPESAAAAPAEGSPPSDSPPPEAPDSKGFLVRGSATYPDGAPAEWFALVLRADGGPSVFVNGKAGRFEARVPVEGTYRLATFIADGERHPYLPGEVEIERGRAVEFRLERETAVRLLVVEAESGKPVPGAVAMRPIGMARGRRHAALYPRFRPGEARTLRGDADGRIELGGGKGIEWVHVVAKGRAWARVEIPWAAGGEVTVRLHPGGSVRVRAPGWAQLEEAALLLTDEASGEACVVEGPGADEEVLLEGLRCGAATFTVRRGGTPSAGDRGSGVVEVVAGEERTLALDLRVPDQGTAVAVSGTVRFHPAWKRTGTLVRFTGAEDGNSDVERLVDAKCPAHGAPLVFSLGRVPAGWYQVEIEPQWRTVVDVSQDESSFDFEIPEPVEVRVVVVESETGDPVRGATLHWHRPMPVGSVSHPTAIPRDPGSGAFVILAPPGPVAFSVEAPWRVGELHGERLLHHEDESPDYAPGEKVDRVVRLLPAGAIRVLLRVEGGVDDREQLEVWLHSTEELREGIAQSTAWGGEPSLGKWIRQGIPPGVYELEVRDGRGRFATVPRRSVEIVAGQTTEVVLDLVRRK